MLCTRGILSFPVLLYRVRIHISQNTTINLDAIGQIPATNNGIIRLSFYLSYFIEQRY